MRFALVPGVGFLERDRGSGEWRPAEPAPAAEPLQGYFEWCPFDGSVNYYLEADVPTNVLHVQLHQQERSACFWLGETGEAERIVDD